MVQAFTLVVLSVAGRVGARRVGDVEGVRQSTGNWQRDPNMKWKRRVIVRRLKPSEIKQSVEARTVMGEMEMQLFMEESKKKPEPIRSPQMHHHHHHHGQADRKKKKQKKQQQTHSYSTRSVREMESFDRHDSEVSLCHELLTLIKCCLILKDPQGHLGKGISAC